jgi:8-oxo-dGTP pyrophosphatase MutT (NUDIX family)
VQFVEVARRLERVPGRLPPPPAALVPVRLDTGERRPPAPPTGTAPVAAAVLVLIAPDETGRAAVALTERADRGGHHSGEVSFPGGRAEPEDADLVATAMREAAEEVALDPARDPLRVAGSLDPFWIPVSNFQVTPVLALAERRPTLVPSEAEVAQILWAPVAAFLPEAPIETVERTIQGWPLRYGGYRIDGLHVWGATALILGRLGTWLGRDGA